MYALDGKHFDWDRDKNILEHSQDEDKFINNRQKPKTSLEGGNNA